MKPATMQPSDEAGQFIRDQTPRLELPKAWAIVGLRPSGGYGDPHRKPAHGELDDPNAPVIDSGHPPRIHDRIRRVPGLLERILDRLKFWPDPDPYEIPEYLRHQKD
jgi:hypothetical protein